MPRPEHPEQDYVVPVAGFFDNVILHDPRFGTGRLMIPKWLDKHTLGYLEKGWNAIFHPRPPEPQQPQHQAGQAGNNGQAFPSYALGLDDRQLAELAAYVDRELRARGYGI